MMTTIMMMIMRRMPQIKKYQFVVLSLTKSPPEKGDKDATEELGNGGMS